MSDFLTLDNIYLLSVAPSAKVSIARCELQLRRQTCFLCVLMLSPSGLAEVLLLLKLQPCPLTSSP